jgi:tRNA-Thr(GGU) m(6)t(6)A37 methyltransferase TsaA
MSGYTLTPIGMISTPFKTKEECPIQSKVANEAVGTVTVFPEYAAGLKDIEMFSHLFLIYLFDRAGEVVFARKTFLDDTPHGIYASRHPCRPNSIGLSIVTLRTRKDSVLSVAGIDVLDNTPLVDIKPYVPRFDAFPEASNGWVGEKPFRPKPRGRE